MPSEIVMRMVAFLGVLLLLMATATKTHALIPYPTRPSSLSRWDVTDDPFKILEQTPFNIPSAAALRDTLTFVRADWKETATAHVITLDIQGMKKEDVKIEVEENKVLRISGERKAEKQVEGDKWHRAERTNDKFWRQFRLPGNADVDQIKAHLEEGCSELRCQSLLRRRKGSLSSSTLLTTTLLPLMMQMSRLPRSHDFQVTYVMYNKYLCVDDFGWEGLNRIKFL